MNFLVYSIGMLGFWAVGFALQMGGVGALGTFGGDATLSHEFVVHVGGKRASACSARRASSCRPACFTTGVATLFLFQMVFMDTTATIPTGAMAERWRFSSFVLFSFVIATLIYPIYANWVWGGGWLSTLGHNFGLGHGHVDFAGSSVVHMVGGVLRSSAPRCSGRASASTRPTARRGRSPGTTSRWSCSARSSWRSAGSASTRARRWRASTRASRSSPTNTMLASARAARSARTCTWSCASASPTSRMLCNGMLAGLVAITAPCAFVSAPTRDLHRRWSPACWSSSSAVFIENTLQDRRSGRRVVGARRVRRVGHPGRWACSPNGTLRRRLNGVAGHGARAALRRSRAAVAECIGLIVNVAWVGDHRRDRVEGARTWCSATASPCARSVRAWTCPRWGCRATRTSRARAWGRVRRRPPRRRWCLARLAAVGARSRARARADTGSCVRVTVRRPRGATRCAGRGTCARLRPVAPSPRPRSPAPKCHRRRRRSPLAPRRTPRSAVRERARPGWASGA